MEDMSKEVAGIMSKVLGRDVSVGKSKVIMHPKDMIEADLDDDERTDFLNKIKYKEV